MKKLSFKTLFERTLALLVFKLKYKFINPFEQCIVYSITDKDKNPVSRYRTFYKEGEGEQYYADILSKYNRYVETHPESHYSVVLYDKDMIELAKVVR